jgi:hypothetical protein
MLSLIGMNLYSRTQEDCECKVYVLNHNDNHRSDNLIKIEFLEECFEALRVAVKYTGEFGSFQHSVTDGITTLRP